MLETPQKTAASAVNPLKLSWQSSLHHICGDTSRVAEENVPVEALTYVSSCTSLLNSSGLTSVLTAYAQSRVLLRKVHFNASHTQAEIRLRSKRDLR